MTWYCWLCQYLPENPIPRVWPPSWDWRRVAEIKISLYQSVVGLYLWVDPAAMTQPAYARLTDHIGPHAWAVLIWCVVLGHATAVWLNGRSSHVSIPIRLAVCAAHGWLLLKLLVGFLAVGYWWPVITMIYFLYVVWGAASIAVDDLIEWRKQCRNPR